jgi:hypothetical protein
MAFYLIPLNTGVAFGAKDKSKKTHAAAVGQFTSVVGNVKQTSSKKVINPVENSSIQLNDIIATGKDSSATIAFSGDSTIRLEQNSRLEISSSHFKKKSLRDILTLTTQGMANVTCTNGSLMLSALSADGKVTSTETLEAGQKAVIAGGAITISKIAAAAESATSLPKTEPIRAAGGKTIVTTDKSTTSSTPATPTDSKIKGEKAGGKELPVTTKVKHKPISYFVAEKRIRLDAEVSDKAGVELVRCYFKGKKEADYVFVTMTQGDIGEYSTILPAPNRSAETIEYLFLVVNKSNQVVKTQTFSVKRDLEASKTPSWQNLPLEGTIRIGIELGEAPEKLEGFNDSITMDIVESSLRFGFVAGLYSTIKMVAAGGVGSGSAAASGTAATATAGGTITATSGMSAAAIAGLAIGGAALVGGGVTAAAGGIGGSSSSTTTTTTTTNPPSTTDPPTTTTCTTAQTRICSNGCSGCSCGSGDYNRCAYCYITWSPTPICPTLYMGLCVFDSYYSGIYYAGGRNFTFYNSATSEIIAYGNMLDYCNN